MAGAVLACAAAQAAEITMTRLNLSFPNPVGIDYHPVNNTLVMSVNWATGEPNNFATVNVDGEWNPFSNLHGWPGEIKIWVAKQTFNGFNLGDMFATGGGPGQVGRLNAQGQPQVVWMLTDEGSGYQEEGWLAGGMYVSKPTDGWNGDLIAVSSIGNVWRVQAGGTAHRIAAVTTNAYGVWLEGVVTVPNDARYGPWAGKIVAGTENTYDCRLFSISANGQVDHWEVLDDDTGWPIQAEEIEIIPPNQHLYAVNYGRHGIYYANADQFSGMVGDILVAQEGIGLSDWGAKLFRVYWDPNEGRFRAQCVFTATQGPTWEPPTWEQFCFAPIVVSPPAGTTMSIVASPANNTVEDAGVASEAGFIVSRTGDPEQQLTVQLSYPETEQPAFYWWDYYLTNEVTQAEVTGTVFFDYYVSSVAFKLVPIDDRQDEGTENATVALVPDPAFTVDPQHGSAICTIEDDAADDAGPHPLRYNVYSITPTSGTYYQNWSEAYGINNASTVAGFFNPPPNYSQWTPHACRAWYNAPKVDLNPGPNWWSWGYAINNNGIIVGSARPGSGGDYACWWSADNTWTAYPQIYPNSYGNVAVAVNDNGIVVGSGKNQNGVVQAIRWEWGWPLRSLSRVNPAGAVSYAYGVSPEGRIIGKSRTDDSGTAYHAFRTDADGWWIYPDTDDLGTSTGVETDSSEALGINCVGETIGATHVNTGAGKRYHAFYRNIYPGKNVLFADLSPDTYWSKATGISNQGHIVGAYKLLSNSAQAGFVRYNDGTLADLWSLADPAQRGIWQFTTPQAINENGLIVGVGHVNGYYARGFILVPVWE